jgi:RNase P subunit RPR2
MSKTRSCKRCNGEEFIMTTDSGAVITWRNAAGKESTWFCPSCDWGDQRSAGAYS